MYIAARNHLPFKTILTDKINHLKNVGALGLVRLTPFNTGPFQVYTVLRFLSLLKECFGVFEEEQQRVC